jgi:Family of unknown function (DUF5994)
MTTSPNASPHPATRVPLRLQLLDSPSTGHIGGVWWPQSRDLQVEAADLVDHFPDQVGHIDRLLFSRPDWDHPGAGGRGVRRIRAGRGPVKVSSFPSDDSQLMVLLLASGRRVSLTVIASATDPVAADRQFQALSEDTSGAPVETAHARSHTEDTHSWM